MVNRVLFTVQAVCADVPENSHFEFDLVCSMENHPCVKQINQWNGFAFYNYYKLNKGTDIAEFQSKINKYLEEKHEKPENVKVEFQNIRDIHLKPDRQFEISGNSSMKYIYVYSTIAIFLIFIAMINYINLSTAKFNENIEELKIRKIHGEIARLLNNRYTIEAISLALLSCTISIVLLDLTKHYIFNLLETEFEINIFSQFTFLLVISISLIILTLIMFRQIAFIQSKDLGYDRHGIIVVPSEYFDLAKYHSVIKSELTNNPNIESVTIVSDLPSNINWPEEVEIKGIDEHKTMITFATDENFIKTTKLKLKAGTTFKEYVSDSIDYYIVNEMAAKIIAENDGNALGKRIRVKHSKLKLGEVVGIVENFNFKSLHIEYSFLDAEYDKLYKADAKSTRIITLFSLLSVIIAVLGVVGLSAYEAINRTKEIGIRKVNGATVLDILLLFNIKHLRSGYLLFLASQFII